MILSTILGSICVSVSHALIDAKQPLMQDLAIASLMTALFAPVLLGLVHLFFGTFAAINLGLWRAMAVVTFVTLTVCFARRILPGIETVTYFWTKRDPVQPRLMQRLPPDETGLIIRLVAQDHAVQVITETGTHTLRMRMGDAVTEMEPVEGYATHRSHWISRSAVAGHVRKDGKLFILLINGDRVPVSRTHRSALEEAGLL
ncbi:MAG: LytTR family DNA-binding domain-containing protein [Pseudomonadota bacterium]